MKGQRIVQVALLLFVAASVVYLVVGEFRKPTATGISQQASTEGANLDISQAKVVAYYFHGNFRCVSCRKLESLAYEAVINGFAEEIKRGDLQWRAVNVEERENEHFISDYRLFSRALVVVRFKDGKQVAYKNLMRAWELLRDDEALKKYVQSEVGSYLQEK